MKEKLLTEVEALMIDWELYDDPASRVQHSFSKKTRSRARRLLVHHGIHSLEILCKMNEERILMTKGFGRAQLSYVNLLLWAYGLRLGMENVPTLKEALAFRQRRAENANKTRPDRAENEHGVLHFLH